MLADVQQLVEIFFLVVIEAEIEKTDSTRLFVGKRVDEADVVKGQVCGILPVELFSFVKVHQAERCDHFATSVQADSGRIRTHDGYVGSQGAHGTTHTHKTRGSV